jgi:hypothetical protein
MYRLSGGQISQEVGGNVGELPPLSQSLVSISNQQRLNRSTHLYGSFLVLVQCDQSPLKHVQVCGSKATTKQPRIMLVVTYLPTYLVVQQLYLLRFCILSLLARQKMFDL